MIEVEVNGRPRSLYSVLGVSPRASPAEIRTAYRKLALVCMTISFLFCFFFQQFVLVDFFFRLIEY
jgi:DnaJ domain